MHALLLTLLFHAPAMPPSFPAGSDGQMGCVAPLSLVLFRRLFSLHQQLTYNMEHYAGLNPTAYRWAGARQDRGTEQTVSALRFRSLPSRA